MIEYGLKYLYYKNENLTTKLFKGYVHMSLRVIMTNNTESIHFYRVHVIIYT